MKRLFLLLALLLPATPAPAQEAPRGSTLLRPARVFDAVDGRTHPGWVVLVTGEKIAAAGPEAGMKIPQDARTIALSGLTLLPGFMDIHSHIFLHPYDETLWDDQVLKEPPAYRTVRAVRHVRFVMKGGIVYKEP